MPPEKELARQVVVVIGAGSGHWQSRRPARGAGRRARGLRRPGRTGRPPVGQELMEIHGAGIGVAGTGISACGLAVGLPVDITSRERRKGHVPAGRAGLWRHRQRHHHRRHLRAPGPDGRIPTINGADLRHQRHRQLHRRR